jgi:hypothetical protein
VRGSGRGGRRALGAIAPGLCEWRPVGAGVVRAATGGARGLCERHWLRSAGKNRVAVSGGARGEAGQATRRGCEAQRGPLGHCGEGVC